LSFPLRQYRSLCSHTESWGADTPQQTRPAMLAKQHYNQSQSKQPNMCYHEDQSANESVDMDVFNRHFISF